MRSLLIIAISIISATAYSQKTTTQQQKAAVQDSINSAEKLNDVIINSNKTNKPVSAARSGIKVMDLPQSVQVISNEVIEQQQAIRLSEVVKNANGMYVSSARGGAQESFYSRGYDMGANNMLKNGFRYNAGSIPDVASLERVEFLKGGSALLYGNVAPGGILNLVTKTPKFEHGGEVSMQIGSYAYYKPTIDFYGPLNNSIAYRINASYENSESFRDVVKNERFYFNPSFLFKVSEKTTITVQGDYLTADWTPDFGTGMIGTEIIDSPRNAFYGAVWSNGTTKSASASGLVNHNFNDNWKLNFNTSYQTYDRGNYSTAQLSGLDTYATPGDWNRSLAKNRNLEDILGDQLSLQGKFNTGKIKHQIYTGVDWENSFATSYTYTFNEEYVMVNGKYSPTIYDMINLFTFDPANQRTDMPISERNTQIAKTDTNRFGVYFQDLISVTDQIKVLAGIRWSWQEAEVTTYKETNGDGQPEIAVPTVGVKSLDNAFSPKLGLVYQPTNDISLFASYSNSFSPNSGTTVNLEPIKASIIDQYEAGIKTDFFKGKLTTNVTVYSIKNTNLAQTAEFKADGSLNTDTSIKVLSGETESKGIEVDFSARPIEGFNINAGYSYNDMRYTKTSGLNGSFIEGDRLTRTPQNTANLSFFYTVQAGLFKGVALGAIGNYIGDRVGGWNDQYSTDLATYPDGIRHREIPLDGYTTIDVSAGYTWRKIAFLLKLSNVTNELNYTVHENYSVNPIAPRQLLGTLKYKF